MTIHKFLVAMYLFLRFFLKICLFYEPVHPDNMLLAIINLFEDVKNKTVKDIKAVLIHGPHSVPKQFDSEEDGAFGDSCSNSSSNCLCHCCASERYININFMHKYPK